MRRILPIYLSALAYALCLPRSVLAGAAAAGRSGEYFEVPGLNVTFNKLAGNLIGFLAYASLSFCTALFLIGAFMMVFFAYDENRVKTGKDIMKGALIGYAVILGAYGILRTAFFIIYDLGPSA